MPAVFDFRMVGKVRFLSATTGRSILKKWSHFSSLFCYSFALCILTSSTAAQQTTNYSA